MNVPTLKGQQVGQAPIPNGYAQVEPSAVAEGAGVGAGLASFGEEADRVMRQANFAAVSHAEATGQGELDRLRREFANMDGTVALQQVDGTLDSADKVTRDIRAKLTNPKQQEDFDLWLAREMPRFQGDIYLRADAIRQNVGVGAFVNSLDANVAAASGQAGTIRYTQTPTLPDSEDNTLPSPSGTEQYVLTTGGADAYLEEGFRKIDEMAAAHEKDGMLPFEMSGGQVVDVATWTYLAKKQYASRHHLAVLDGMLSPEPGQTIDGRAAKEYLKIHAGEIEPSEINKITDRVDAAYVMTEGDRLAGVIWMQHAQDEGTWTDKVGVMKKAAHELDVEDGVRTRILDNLTKLEAGARAAEDKGVEDRLTVALERVAAGDDATSVESSVSGLPVSARNAVHKALENRAEGVEQEMQDQIYSEWHFKATGWDPSTGERSDKARKEFLALTPSEWLAKQPLMGSTHWNELNALRDESAAGNKATSHVFSESDIVMSVVNRTVPEMTDEDHERSNYTFNVKRQLDALWQQADPSGRGLSLEEKLRWADELVATTVFDRAGAGKGSHGEPENLTVLEVLSADPRTLDVDDIPDEWVEAYRANYKHYSSLEPSDTSIIVAYQKKIREGLIEAVMPDE